MVFSKTMGPPDQPPSPQLGAPDPASGISTHRSLFTTITPPSQLCNWAIHVNIPRYEPIPDPPSVPTEPYDMDDEASWPQWGANSTTLSGRMAESLSETDFTSITSQELPMSTSAIIRSVQRSPEQLEADALSFAIIAGNYDTVVRIIERHAGDPPLSDSSPSPFHLAASFMMGSKTCCDMYDVLLEMHGNASIGLHFRDNKGYTVLDMLFVKILSAHTSAKPIQVSDGFEGQARFPGEERDPCGRWDADSPCVRRLYASGQCRIPQDWKHPFCHTSVQAICHSITAIFSKPQSPSINTRSGLFSRGCQSCRQRLELTPLHSLLLVAFHLAVNGRRGETLFGAIACLSALLVHGADPHQTAEVSKDLLTGHTVSRRCDHKPANAAQLAENVSEYVLRACVPGAEPGWRAFVLILQHATAVAKKDRSYQAFETPLQCECKFACFSRGNFSCTDSPFLGTIWAFIQAEFLTYRRIAVDDPWISSHFNIEAVSLWLEGKTGILETGFQMEGMLKPYSRCGWFMDHWAVLLRPCPDEIGTEYFINMEDWSRSTFIEAVC